MNTEFPLFNDKNVKYTGTSNSNTGVSQGDSIHVVLEKLTLSLSHLIDKVNSCSFCEDDSENVSLLASDVKVNSSVTQNSIITSPKQAKITTSPNATGVMLTYDLRDAVSSLGDNVTILKTNTSLTGLKDGYPTTIANTDKQNVTLALRPDNFPVNMSSQVRYRDSQGEKVVGFNIPISNTSSNISVPLQGNSAGAASISNQEDLNNNLQSRILNVENTVNQLNNINIPGSELSTGNISEALAFVLSELENIKSQLP